MAAHIDKENFVKNLNGTTITEITGIVSCAPICCLIYFLLQSALVLNTSRHGKGYTFLAENAILVFPNLFILTIFESYAWVINTLGLIGCGFLAIWLISMTAVERFDSDQRDLQSKKSKPYLERKQFVSNFRAFMNIATILSILAVDFKIFPRRLAKAEVYGTGFMDIGVGSFIFGHAIVSTHARGAARDTSRSHIERVSKQFMGCIPIIFLGIIRLATVKGTNYHEHVTEYGVHWNFFFTLAFVKFFAGTFIQLLSRLLQRQLLIFGFLLCVSYQMLLVYFGWADFVKNGSRGDGSRNNLIDANREGLLSCLGYTGLFLVASHLGTIIFKSRTKAGLLKQLILIDASLWLATIFCNRFIDKVSRQMANLSYILWILSLNVYLLVCFLLVDVVQDDMREKVSTQQLLRVPPRSPRRTLCHEERKDHLEQYDMYKEPLLVKAISHNQLTYFLLGNVLTGFINLSIHTVAASDLTAMAILIVYVLVTNGSIVLLHVKGISTKFW